MADALQDLLDAFSPEVQTLALAARDEIQKLVPDAQEKIIKGHKAISYGFGQGMKDQFAALVLHRAHVNLQLTRGTELPDPSGILEGTGKAMRHVKIREAEALQREDVRTLIQAAVAKARNS